jgi:hypothetical protein
MLNKNFRFFVDIDFEYLSMFLNKHDSYLMDLWQHKFLNYRTDYIPNVL